MTRPEAGPEPVEGIQLDLFGEVERVLTLREARAAARLELERRARSYPDGSEVVWTAPWDCGDGTPKGTRLPGWRCWLCGQVEVNEYLLNLNHGLANIYPDSLDRDQCTRQDLLARQASAARARRL